MAVLRQQLVFVEHLQETGMLSEREAGLMSVPIDMRVRKLSHQGPVWRAPLTHDVLRSIPILHEVRGPCRFLAARPSPEAPSALGCGELPTREDLFP